MKLKQISLIVLTLIILTGIAFCVESQSDDSRPVIGILLDTSPLPPLLTKHLGLKPGQGIRIGNIMKGSSAEDAGLDVDDIVIAFEGKDLYERETLTNTVRNQGIGAEVTMDVIHLGQRKTVTLKLKPLKETKGWKYENQPLIERSFQPTRILSLDPNSQDWNLVLEDQLPENIKSDIRSMFKEKYNSTYTDNGKQYSVTIEGNPKDKNSKITVKIDNGNEITKTIGELEDFQKDYKEAAKKAIENATPKSMYRFPSLSFDFGDIFVPQFNSGVPSINSPDVSSDPFLEDMEEQMKLMKEQFRMLEESHKKLLERLHENQQ